ncbi:MAG: Ni,Fe-hydrogenase III large subunit, partial [Gammaproteobacteria bacterium]
RWAGLWADPVKERVDIFCLLEYQGNYLVLGTRIPIETPVLSSHTPYFPGADRLERHAQDMAGVAFVDHPDERRWTRHRAWGEGEFPLREDFPVQGHRRGLTPPDDDYPFRAIEGTGVDEIPVGPVHAGIIEPGHFRFQAVGETVLRLEERLGYVHKGIEKIASGRDPIALARLAGRVSGDSTVAHAWAACQAMERAAGLDVPERALFLRAIMAERERIANHLGDIGAICNDVGFAFAWHQCARLREWWQRENARHFGHRFMMDAIVPGGVAFDLAGEGIERLRDAHLALRQDIGPLFDILEDHPGLEDRLLGTGRLDPEAARALGCTGYVGRASGMDFDVRRHSPYGPYDRLKIPGSCLDAGDVAARMQIRMEEVIISLDILDQLLDQLPGGPCRTAFPAPPEGAEGLGIIDGWRGEIASYVRFGTDGHIARFFPRDPSWFTWPALERLMHGNIVPDFPVCNKSINGSYSGHDL